MIGRKRSGCILPESDPGWGAHAVRAREWGSERHERSLHEAARSPRAAFLAMARVLRDHARGWWGIVFLLSALLALVGARLWLSSNVRTGASGPTPVNLPSVPDEARTPIRALAESVLRAVRFGDRVALERLRFTRDEFCRVLWPALPPTPNLSCEWAWSAYAPQDVEGIHRVLKEHGGRDYTLLRVEPRRVVSYGDVRVYEHVRLIVMDETGQERAVRLFGSICELRGTFRLCSFILE